MNKLNMQAFILTGFDLEYRKPDSIHWQVGLGLSIDDTRPRINNPQVLDSYDFVKEVEGAVWDFYGMDDRYEESVEFQIQNARTNTVSRKNNLNGIDIIWLLFKGVESGAGLDDWAKAHNVPVIEVK